LHLGERIPVLTEPELDVLFRERDQRLRKAATRMGLAETAA